MRTTQDYLDLSRQDIINEFESKDYFDVREFVGPEVFAKHGRNSWFVMSTELLRVMLFIRERKGKAITGNTWHYSENYKGTRFKERGHRANIQNIVKGKTEDGVLYTSGHPLGLAFDFTIKGETAEETREWIISIEDELPHKVRLEHRRLSTGEPITWVHLDVKYFESNPKVYLFDIP